MSDNIKQEISKIEIPKELSKRSKLGVAKAKAEIPTKKRNWIIGIALAASLLIAFGSYTVYKNSSQNNNTFSVTKDGGIQIPALILPKDTSAMSMIGLIVFNGKIYTQTATEIDEERAKDLLGEKLGTTKSTIDEWSTQDAYAVEFASTVGELDVYTVRGYSKDYRIITYSEQDGHSEIFEALNGITVYSGQDIFEKLHLSGNIVHAQYRYFSDWDNSVENYYPIKDKELLNSFIEALNETVPHPYERVEAELGDFRNDENYRELSLHLKDGTKVNLVVLKDGYIRYGYLDVYFKMENETFSKIWQLLYGE
ncbi:hypothetical protein [Neobacillus sp. FSL H8-0543]|uniref:hypothetical protein n=1 Tax=Neobacillus sp. FSL H8-0543 TaxID=2954672 RepID=UPI0031585B64